jgi:hypothetical protein
MCLSLAEVNYIGLCNYAYIFLDCFRFYLVAICLFANPNATIYSALSAVMFCLVTPNPDSKAIYTLNKVM